MPPRCYHAAADRPRSPFLRPGSAPARALLRAIPALALLLAQPAAGAPGPAPGWYIGKDHEGLGFTLALKVSAWKGQTYTVTGKLAHGTIAAKNQIPLAGAFYANTNRLALEAHSPATKTTPKGDQPFDGSYDDARNAFHVTTTLHSYVGAGPGMATLTFDCVGPPKPARHGGRIKFHPMSKEDTEAMRRSVPGGVPPPKR